MTDRIAGARALVTGASSGIGASLAVALAREGATVAMCARREDRLTEVYEQVRAMAPESRMWVFDVGELDAIRPAGDAGSRIVDAAGFDRSQAPP